jgi:hypothetical protein
MKVPTVVALVLAVTLSGSSSAQPREEEDVRPVPYGHAQPQFRHDGDWVKLATPTPTRFGTEWIILGRDLGAFRTLKIQATSGTVHLRRVRVEFSNGRVTTFRVDRWLARRRPDALIDLGAARYIDRIAVTTTRVPAGHYVVYGAWRTRADRVASR